MIVSLFGIGLEVGNNNLRKLRQVDKEVKFEEFLELFKVNAKILAWSPVRFRNGVRNKNSVITPVGECLLVLDIDNPTKLPIGILDFGKRLGAIVLKSKSKGYHIIVPVALRNYNYIELLQKTKLMIQCCSAFDPVVLEPTRLFFVAPVGKRQMWDFRTEPIVDIELLSILSELLGYRESEIQENSEKRRPIVKGNSLIGNLSELAYKVDNPYTGYTCYVLSLLQERVKNFNVVKGEDYIAFDGVKGYNTPLSVYHYFGSSFVCLYTPNSLERLRKQFMIRNLFGKLKVKEQNGLYIVGNVPKFMQYLALSYGVQPLPYKLWLDYRWLFKFGYIKLLYDLMKSGREFRMSPEFGFTFSKFGTRSDRRLRKLKQVLKDRGIIEIYGSAGKMIRFINRDTLAFVKAIFEALMELQFPTDIIISMLRKTGIKFSYIAKAFVSFFRKSINYLSTLSSVFEMWTDVNPYQYIFSLQYNWILFNKSPPLN